MKKNNQTNTLLSKFSLKHPKLLKFLKSNVKAFLITGVLIFAFTASATAVKILHSRQVRYKDGKSVETAINELYEKADEFGLLDKLEMKKIGCNGCAKLEYLESTGNEYIDTNFMPNQDTTVDIQVEFIKLKSGGNDSVFGSRNDAYSKHYGLTIGSSNTFYQGYNTQSVDTGTITNIGINYHILKEKNALYVNNNKIYESIYNSNTSFSSLYPMYIFSMNQQNNALFRSSIKIYYCKVFDNNTLVRDYIPVLDSNNRPCLFDKVSKTCFYNQGTGEFLYG